MVKIFKDWVVVVPVTKAKDTNDLFAGIPLNNYGVIKTLGPDVKNKTLAEGMQVFYILDGGHDFSRDGQKAFILPEDNILAAVISNESEQKN